MERAVKQPDVAFAIAVNEKQQKACRQIGYDCNNVLSEISVLLTWNCDVAITTTGYGPSKTTTLTTTLANLDLNLWSVAEDQTKTLVDWSASTVDNVEHLWLTSLVAGNYAIGVTSDPTVGTDYALAWYSGMLVAPVPEPGTLLMLAAGFAVGFAVFARRRAGRPLRDGG